MSLLTHYNYDLRDWIQGRDKRSPLVLLSMARNLPEGSLLSARLSAQHELHLREMKQTMSDEEFQELVESQSEMSDLERLTSERMSWNLQNSLTAMLVNMLAPGEEAVIGPSAWLKQEADEQKNDEEEPKPGRLQSFFAQMGGE